jgi:hypothetical protein
MSGAQAYSGLVASAELIINGQGRLVASVEPV